MSAHNCTVTDLQLGYVQGLWNLGNKRPNTWLYGYHDLSDRYNRVIVKKVKQTQTPHQKRMTRRRELQTQLKAYREQLGTAKFKEVAQSRLVHYSTESDPVILELIVISTNTYVGMGYHYLGLNSSGLNSSTQCLEQALALVKHYLAQQEAQALTDQIRDATIKAWEGGIPYCMLPGMPYRTYYSYRYCEYASCDLADAPRTMDKASCPLGLDCPGNGDCWECRTHKAVRTTRTPYVNGASFTLLRHVPYIKRQVAAKRRKSGYKTFGNNTRLVEYRSAQRLQADKAHDYACRHGWEIVLPSRTTG